MVTTYLKNQTVERSGKDQSLIVLLMKTNVCLPYITHMSMCHSYWVSMFKVNEAHQCCWKW